MSGNSATVPLALFSGLAADASVFVPQKLAFPQLQVPAWLPPAGDESLDDYGLRMADRVSDCRGGVIGGASFGGFVALHVAAHLPVQAVVLIGSLPCPSQLPPRIRRLRPLAPLVKWLPVRFV